MGILDRMFEPRGPGIESRATKTEGFHVSQTPPGWIDELFGSETASGAVVNADSAMQVSTVFACIRVLAEGVGALPLHLYERQRDGGRQRATGHPLYPLLRYLPNPEMTSITMRETLQGHAALRGNAFAEIAYNGAGQITELWPLRVDKMRGMERRDGKLWYVYQLPDKLDGIDVGLPMERVLHVRGLSHDGLWGYSVLDQARQSMGLALATEEFGSRFFGNGARPSGVLEHPGVLTEAAQGRLLQSWEAKHKGLEKAHRLAILEEGMKYHEIGLAPEDAQFLETRKFQVAEICRWFRVQPHLVGDLERATFSNIEQQSREFIDYSLMPWLVRWEQEIYRTLLTPSERARYFAEHLADNLLRGETKTRYEAYAIARNWGWMSADDVRERENMNPLPGGQGQIYFMPLNMIPASMAAQAPGGERGREGEGERGRRGLERIQPVGEQRGMASAQHRHRLLLAYLPLFLDVGKRIARRERNDVGAAARKMMGKRATPEFLLWLEDFYREHAGWVADQARALYESYAGAVAPVAQDEVGGGDLADEIAEFLADYVAMFGQRYADVSRIRIRQVVEQALTEGQDPLEALEMALDGWEEVRGAEVARWESARFNNAISVVIYGLVGRELLRWLAFGESCPYCSALNGQVIGIREWFLQAGEEFQPDGAERPLVNSSNVGHPPAHDGCDCMVVAG